ncbi:polysaccharide deacetylase family protein [Sphingobium nicotianae]|uniref:Chitooligosaccharide deacetylase n=1 Tax=Sphingobium nicotianae TaxID=2782607 RepID=A0A9X1DBX9_9SPHN|nr:polysaccharide deacetylase family protein [Sphingobium nicotianae]MBT2187089.1 glycosyltransferase [Sphingobium nicotianae]
MTSPIFFDATGRRRRLVGRATALLVLLVLLCAAVFAATLVNVPAASPLQFGHEREQALPFRTHVARLRHRVQRLLGANGHSRAAPGKRLTVGFYVPWDSESASSLRAHYDQLDWVVAAEGVVDLTHGRLVTHQDGPLRAMLRSRLHRPRVMLMVQNIAAGQWDGAGMMRLFQNRAASDKLIDDTIAAVVRTRWQGAVFDIENLPDRALPLYRAFLARAHARFAKAGLTLALTVPGGEPAWDMRAFAAVVDQLMLMDYDQHWQGGESGPIASQDWFAAQVAEAREKVPAQKLIVALASYGYDWHDGIADALTIGEAWLSASDSGTTPTFDPASGNSGFAFDDDGHRHVVWMMDAATSWNQLQLLHGVGGVALWRLGSEDPGFWEALAASKEHRPPRLGVIAPPQGTDVEGSGELLRISALPTGGRRAVGFGQDGSVIAERYTTLPTPYRVTRTGAADRRAIALTFDDGPDPDYTPRILDVLASKHAPATFFLIGENALEHPEILRRIVRDGHEIGNHSYTHPNMAEETALGTTLELNATQRLIEAYTGRSTRLFRAPYFGDAEPTTADELVPATIAQQHGYTIVGLHVDPDDWKTPGVQAIIDATMRKVHAANDERSGNIVLLHDGGGNRDQTVAALPIIIDRLRAEGYRIVPVSQLAGLSRDAVMPIVKGSDLLAVRADVGFFLVLAMIGYAIRWLFFFAIALGIARALLLTTLALIDRKASHRAPTNAPQPKVSVIIPAYNEEKVIVDSITRVLASDYPALELIIADDGSKDATSALVARHYGADPRVRLLTLVNGGKASALNRALGHASGEIIIALDADTQFLPDTIAKLVRWFANPRIGAVAGNARVGNKVNLVTRWQAIEYVTAQNVERRALDALKAITVVPGAVGAWRRAALDEVGGYPEDTLAEDQDLTIAIQRLGWWVEYDVEAIALTEAPETLRALGKQRYRWSFGTLQCLWKHREVLKKGRPRGLAWFGMPQAWLFQIVFAALSPIIDLALLLSIVGTIIRVHQHGWDQTQSDVLRMGVYWAIFVSVDLIAGWIAYRLEPTRQRFPGLLMIAQRFVYRQLMYGVVLRSIAAALRGRVVGWGKLERTGSVTVTPAG